MKYFAFVFSFICLLSIGMLNSNIHAQEPHGNASKTDWIPTGEWPFINKKFLPATVITGYIHKKKTICLCNIHVGKQTLYYVMNDSLMEANSYNVNYVEFNNGDKYQSLGNVFAKIIQEDSIGKVLMVRLVDESKLRKNFNDISAAGSLTIDGDFGEIALDLMPAYIHNPEEEPLPIIDKFFFNYNMNIFEVTYKNVLNHINQNRKKEFKAFTRSAEILTHNESSVRKIWDNFFVKY